jgi:membrane protein YqaA with SNARE-associated domain
VGTLELMMLLVVVAAAVLGVVAAVIMAIWARRHRARRDLEGHFQNEWVNRERWASLADVEPQRPEAGREPSAPITSDQ